MTIKLSPHKITRLLRMYLLGFSQLSIAEKIGVNQATVSLYESAEKVLSVFEKDVLREVIELKLLLIFLYGKEKLGRENTFSALSLR